MTHSVGTSPAPSSLRVGDRLARAEAGVALPVSDTARPALSWIVPLVRDGQEQTAYRIVASADGGPRETATLWDSGVVESRENAWVRWGGDDLAAHDRVRWAVATRDELGEMSPWSEPAEIIVPPLGAADWPGEWISFAPTHAALHSFSAPAAVRATLHFAAQGFVRAVIDGTVVNEGARDPSDAALPRVVSRSYDVSALHARPGRHVLAFVGARGHFHRILNQVRLTAQLHLEFADGSTQTIATDGDWREAPTSLQVESAFYAEVHDERVPDAWAQPGVEADFPPVGLVPASAVMPKIQPDAGPPVAAGRTIIAEPLGEASAVFDLGENVAARSRVRLSGTRAGQRITIVHGELLTDDGHVSTLNLTMPDDRDRDRQAIEWICAGETATIEPWFSIHGFRYLEIRGLDGATVDEVTARATHSAVATTGRFESADPLLDRLVDAARRTQLNNTHAHPEDCPTREQAGWTGDASNAAQAALAHLDIAGVYRNWLRDVQLDQSAEGGIPGMSPFLLGPEHVQPADPVWGSVMTEVPLQVWRTTGDRAFVAEFLPAMRRWADWQVGTLEDGLVRHSEISYGADWLASEQTPPVLQQSAAAERSLRTLAELEQVAGDEVEAARRTAQADTIRSAARAALWDAETGIWGNGSQASFACALTAGWVLDEERPAVEKSLRALVRARGDRLASGYAGTQSVVRALAAADGGEVLLDAVHQPAQPGIGSMLAEGPGTLWETWWIDEPALGIASLDHIGLAGPFAAWAWRDVAGLRELEPGFRRFAVDPRLSHRVPHARITRETVRGTIELEWRRLGDELDLRLVVPVGAIAEIPAPDGGTVALRSGRHDLTVPTTATASDAEDRLFTRAPRPPRPAVGRWTSDDVETISERWVCAPVFHEPQEPPIERVTLRDLGRGTIGEARFELEEPMDAADVSFASVLVDMDNGVLQGQRVTPVLAVHGEHGTTRTGVQRWLPVTWTRVAVDLADWPADERISALSIGMHVTGEPDIARGPEVLVPEVVDAFAFMVAKLGFSSEKRTW